MIVFSKGRFHDLREPAVTLDNGGFLHGYGVFTTLRLYRGRAPFLADHYRRLQEHGDALGLSLPATLAETREVISELCRHNNLLDKDMRLRLTLAAHPDGTLFSAVPGPLPQELEGWQAAGLAAVILGPGHARTHRPDLKTCNYLPSVLALQSAHRAGCQAALITGPDGSLLEEAVSNVFLVLAGELHTPPAEGRILAGLTRARILALARQEGLTCHEHPLGRDELLGAEEIFLTSSVREVVPVVQVDGKPVATGRPGPLTRLLQQLYRPEGS